MISLTQLATDAGYAISDLLDESEWVSFDRLSDIEKVQWRYCHANCDDFALTLAEITGWPVIAISSPESGPLHRLVEAPDGRLLDVKGWVTVSDLAARYKLSERKLHRGGSLAQSIIDSNEDFHPILAAIKQLPYAPFNDAGFQEKLAQFAVNVEFDLPGNDGATL